MEPDNPYHSKPYCSDCYMSNMSVTQSLTEAEMVQLLFFKHGYTLIKAKIILSCKETFLTCGRRLVKPAVLAVRYSVVNHQCQMSFNFTWEKKLEQDRVVDTVTNILGHLVKSRFPINKLQWVHLFERFNTVCLQSSLENQEKMHR